MQKIRLINTLKHAVTGLLLLLATPFAEAGLHGSFTGSWYDPDFTGAGFIVEAIPDNRAVVYWFTYDDEGNQRWYIGIGTSTVDSIVIDELLITSGGVFGDAFDPDAIQLATVGSATFTFSDCSSASVEFEVDGAASSQQLVRLTNIRDLDCEQAREPITNKPPINQTGSWYDTGRSGEGFIVEVLADQRVLVDWFTYDPFGHQAWLTGVGHAAGDYIFIQDMWITSGGLFGPEHDPEAVTLERWGTIELRLGCDGGSALYDAVNPAWGHGSNPLTRLTNIADLDCVEETFVTATADQLAGLWQSDGFGQVARISGTSFSLMQVTSSSCLEVLAGPIDGLLDGDSPVQINDSGDRVRASGQDSVSPIEFDKVDSLPGQCTGSGTDFTAEPVHNFNVFWDTFNELYSAFDVRGVDWDAQRVLHEGSINANSSASQLFNTLVRMLSPLNDGHVSLATPIGSFHAGGSAERTSLFNRAFSANVDLIIINTYLGGTRLQAGNGVLRYGLVNTTTGYLEITRFHDFLNNATSEQNLAFLRQELDTVFAYFRDQNVTGLIFDVRRNTGGDLQYGLEIAGRLSQGETRIAFSERRPTEVGLSEAITTPVTPAQGIGFTGPAALLISPITASAAEIFALAMRAQPHVTLVGDHTQGVLSRSERILPNGWVVSITPGHVEAPDGERYEAVGIPPSIDASTFSPIDLASNRDSTIDAALSALADK